VYEAGYCQLCYGRGEEISVVAYDITGYSKRKVEVMSEILGLVLPRTIIGIINSYYVDSHSRRTVFGFCDYHIDNIYQSPKFNIVMRWDYSANYWRIRTCPGPKSS
jgi:hypothetical protein